MLVWLMVSYSVIFWASSTFLGFLTYIQHACYNVVRPLHIEFAACHYFLGMRSCWFFLLFLSCDSLNPWDLFLHSDLYNVGLTVSWGLGDH